jgi:uncharacterized integral membrane protein
LFAVANSHHVEVSLIFGAPIRMRMIFLLAGTFVAGVISTIALVQYREARRHRAELENLKAERESESQEQSDLLDEDD